MFPNVVVPVFAVATRPCLHTYTPAQFNRDARGVIASKFTRGLTALLTPATPDGIVAGVLGVLSEAAPAFRTDSGGVSDATLIPLVKRVLQRPQSARNADSTWGRGDACWIARM